MNTISKTFYEKYMDRNWDILDLLCENLAIDYSDNLYRHHIVKSIASNDKLMKWFTSLGLSMAQYQQGINLMATLLMTRGYGSNIFHVPKDLSMALYNTNSTSSIEMIKMPHRAFFVDVHREDLSLHNGKHLVGAFFYLDKFDENPNEEVPVAQLQFADSGAGIGDIHGITIPLSQLGLDQRATTEEYLTVDKRIVALCTFLCINILLYISSEQADMKRVPAFQGNKPKKKKKILKDKICRVSYVVLGQGFRYSSGISSSSSNRATMKHSVMGHWTHQIYGPKSNPMYKTMWIQPYWRGSDIAGVIEKRHYLAKRKTA